MRWWIIQAWTGAGWIKVDATSTGKGADILMREYAREGHTRYRVVNPDGRVAGHCGTVRATIKE